jgi:hypothetical protein
MVAAVSAKPAPDRIQLAQAQQSDTQSGTSQRQSTGNRGSGAATQQSSQGGGAAASGGGNRATMRGEARGTSRTSVRARSEGARVSVHGSRTRVGVRTAARDEDVVVRRHPARRFVSDEPARATVIKKRRHIVSYREPSSIVVRHRRAGVAVNTGVSTRTNVRSRSGTTVSGSSTTRASGTTGTNMRSSGQGSAGGAATTGRSQSRGTNRSSGSSNEAPATR